MRPVRPHLLALSATVFTLALVASPVRAAVPPDMQIQGYITSSSGVPVTGSYSMVVGIFANQVGGTALWTKTLSVAVDAGVYDAVLDGLPEALFKDNSSLWLETKVGTDAPLPRRRILPSAWAFHSRSSDTAAVAADLACSGCVDSASLASDLRAPGDLKVEKSLILCDGGTGACSVRLNSTATVAADGTAVSVQASTGLKVRNAGNTAWAPLETGPITANGNVNVVGNLTVSGTISGTISGVPWSGITGVPAGFADGVDNDTLYAAGTGLGLAGGVFSADTAYLQRRIGTGCTAGNAIRVVNADGSVTCAPTGATYVAGANGGLVISGSNEISLAMSCASGQLLKYDGTKWACGTVATGATSFAELSGAATDAQIPDDITVNFAQDADTVDGHHYSPVWDSTDAETLGGFPPTYFATKAQVDAINTDLSEWPAIQEAMCNAAISTNVCKKNVYLAGTHERDVNSLMRLVGGSWVFDESVGRCEYLGGMEIEDAKECGDGILPDWMDTTDNCGGFRRSSWDTRIRYAVGKSNIWDKTFDYTCPPGWHWATVDEVSPWLYASNVGAVGTYTGQCGWTTTTWNGKVRRWFRFKDSVTNGNRAKDTADLDGAPIEVYAGTDQFAGIVCAQDGPMEPTDWMLDEDDCQGLRNSTWAAQVYYAVSRKSLYDSTIDYQCPDGYHWATTAEGQALLNGTGGSLTYSGQCGWAALVFQNVTRRYFRFSDSLQGTTTLYYKDASGGDAVVPAKDASFTAASLNNFAGLVCIDDSWTNDPLSWMDQSDACGGFRQSTWDPRFYYAVSKKNVWNKDFTYQCPAGYHWATTAEYDAAFTADATTVDQRVYYNQCGWNAYVWKGLDRRFFRFSDSKTNNRTIRSNNYDIYKGATDTSTANFAGIVCKKDGADPYPKAGTTDWMQTDDDCKGFRQSGWDSRIRYAVSRQNIWKPDFAYQCPTGYHWATKAEADAILNVTADTTSPIPYYKYNGQCGWTGSTWHGRNRRYFRFADSHPTTGLSKNATADANHGEPRISATVTGAANFAGIVCIANAAPTDPLDWMDRTDNCGGFRQSLWDPRVYYAVAKKNVWDKTFNYQCPSGFHWMTYAEAAQIFKSTSTTVYQRVYTGQCGWDGASADGLTWIGRHWHGLDRRWFRFADSNAASGAAANRAKDASDSEEFQTEVQASTANFAGIVCMKDGPADPLAWMETTDNCGGFRQSTSDPTVYYAVSKYNVWDKARTYACPSGYHWATTSEGQALFPTGGATAGATVYTNQCGWSALTWNPNWPLGCSSWANPGCGSAFRAPTPSTGLLALSPGDFARGCTDCDSISGVTCAAGGTAAVIGACDGIDEVWWRNDQHLGGCYTSPNVFSGAPSGMLPGTSSNHCKDGVCCGAGNRQPITMTRQYFRFSDSFSTNAYKDAGQNDNYQVQSSTTIANFAGIICIKD